jgi:Sulfotransferase domain
MTASTETSALTEVSHGRVPDFFVVGHPKCGTTALYEMLRSHPQIYMPDLKETRFLARELHPGLRPDGIYPCSFQEYVSLFERAGTEQRVGEASPSYLRSRAAAQRIAELRPDARIIAILREPASFLRSLHLELVRDNVEPEKDMRRAIAAETLRRQQLDRFPGLVYGDYVHYTEQLRRYHAVFPPTQVLVLIYEDFRADNEATLQSVLRFLSVDEHRPVEQVEANPTVRVRSLALDDFVRSLAVGRGPVTGALKRTVKALTPQRLRRRALGAFRRNVVYGRPSSPDEELMTELRRRYRQEVVAVSEYLNRDLVKLWGYDELG